jgi:hypothetical protein
MDVIVYFARIYRFVEQEILASFIATIDKKSTGFASLSLTISTLHLCR